MSYQGPAQITDTRCTCLTVELGADPGALVNFSMNDSYEPVAVVVSGVLNVTFPPHIRSGSIGSESTRSRDEHLSMQFRCSLSLSSGGSTGGGAIIVCDPSLFLGSKSVWMYSVLGSGHEINPKQYVIVRTTGADDDWIESFHRWGWKNKTWVISGSDPWIISSLVGEEGVLLSYALTYCVAAFAYHPASTILTAGAGRQEPVVEWDTQASLFDVSSVIRLYRGRFNGSSRLETGVLELTKRDSSTTEMAKYNQTYDLGLSAFLAFSKACYNRELDGACMSLCLCQNCILIQIGREGLERSTRPYSSK